MRLGLPLSLLWAWRDLRGGFAGLRLIVACLAVGVAAIAAAGSTAEAFRAGLAANAREVLGGDLAVSVSERRFTARERAILAARGRVAFAAAAQAMATAPSGRRTLAELRGVGDNYPLVGRVVLAGGVGLGAALEPSRGPGRRQATGVAVEDSLLRALGMRLGDQFLVGNIRVVARAVLISEPDRLSRGFALGPRILAPLAAVEGGGLIGAGLPFGETARIVLPAGEAIAPARAALRRALHIRSGSDLRLRDASRISPSIGRLLDQLEFFLSLIGLAALLAGGLGVRGALLAFVERRQRVIATQKALGASVALVRNVHLIEVAAVTLLGIAAGVIAGSAAPPLLGRALAWIAPDLSAPALFAVYPAPLARAAAFGVLASAAFALPPLALASRSSVAALFRGQFSSGAGCDIETIGAGLAGAGLLALTIATAPSRAIALGLVGGIAAAFVLLWLLGWALALGLGAASGMSRGILRLGLAQLAGRPSAARDTAAGLGLGVGLLAAVSLIQSSLIAEVNAKAPRTAPSVVFTGIPEARAAAFDATVARAFGRTLRTRDYERFPYLTGRLVAIRGQPVEREKIAAADRWAWDSDISLSAIGPEPPNAGVIAGRWWPPGWRGPPQVALSLDAARGETVKVGDRLTLSVLGTELDAQVAALRRVDLTGFGPDFPAVLDPNALAGAHLDQVAIARSTPQETRRISEALGKNFPMVGVIDVRAALAVVSALFDRLALAIRCAASVAVLAGALVLVGAVAAGAPARAREAGIFQALGASGGQVIAIYLVEFAAIGLVASLAGLGLGALAAWPVVTLIFQADWSFDRRGAAALAVGAAATATAAGVAAALLALRAPPARLLRSDP